MANAWPPTFESEKAQVGCALSLDEWLALSEDEEGEFVDGYLVEEEVPDFTHGLAVSWLLRVIGSWLAGRGFVVGSELKILTSANPTPRDERRDRVEKMSEYAQ